jgi:hypothetical protein
MANIVAAGTKESFATDAYNRLYVVHQRAEGTGRDGTRLT